MEESDFSEENYKDHYDLTRMALMKNLSYALFILLLLVSLLNIANDNYSHIQNIIGMLVSIISIAYLKVRKDYRTVSMFVSISGFLIISLTFIFLRGVLHYTTPMWMLMNILFTFFMLKRIWGLIILILHFSVMVFFFQYRINDNIQALEPFNQLNLYTFIIEYFICGAGVAYILFQFVKANTHTQQQLTAINLQLSDQNRVISKQNYDKDIMLKEIHHRVKNNLQVITSLLRLQANEISDQQHSSEFEDAIRRVQSMALIHETMYQGDVITNFELKAYLTQLAKDINQTYSTRRLIEIQIDSTAKNIGSKSIVPLSLLFNELITNSIKHAFKNIDNPQINVSIKQNDSSKHFELFYSDNGTWVEQKDRKSFGTELIQVMTEQLDGEFSLEKTSSGTFYQFKLTCLD